jgi:hypothetical protein
MNLPVAADKVTMLPVRGDREALRRDRRLRGLSHE